MSGDKPADAMLARADRIGAHPLGREWLEQRFLIIRAGRLLAEPGAPGLARQNHQHRYEFIGLAGDNGARPNPLRALAGGLVAPGFPEAGEGEERVAFGHDHSGLLYSVEFFRQVRARLHNGGIYVQWRAHTERAVASSLAVFPHVVRTNDVLLGSDRQRQNRKLLRPAS
jgi:hypothetical protein